MPKLLEIHAKAPPRFLSSYRQSDYMVCTTALKIVPSFCTFRYRQYRFYPALKCLKICVKSGSQSVPICLDFSAKVHRTNCLLIVVRSAYNSVVRTDLMLKLLGICATNIPSNFSPFFLLLLFSSPSSSL
jgi:hypothetical protein